MDRRNNMTQTRTLKVRIAFLYPFDPSLTIKEEKDLNEKQTVENKIKPQHIL